MAFLTGVFSVLVMIHSVFQSTKGEGNLKIQPFHFASSVTVGEKATTICLVIKGSMPYTFKWSKDGNAISNIENIKITTSKEHSTLLISPVNEESKGNYSCTVSNADSQETFYAMLNVKAPPKWVSEPESAEVMKGEKINLNCLVSGLPDPLISWKKVTGDPEGEKQDVHSQNGVLQFESVKDTDSGMYECEASNGVGENLRKLVSLKVIVSGEYPA